jgi:hypothetical protein
MVTPGDTRNDAAASLENSIERNGEEGSEVADLSPPRSRKNRVTSDNEVDLLENAFSNLSPAKTTTPRRGQNLKKSKKSVIEFKVGDMIDYWAPATIVFVASNLRTGIITEIYSDEGWDESDDMHEFHLTVGMDPITYGSYIRPVNTEAWIKTSSDSCNCIEGVMKGGSNASAGALANQFQQIREAARMNFVYARRESDSSDGSGYNRPPEPANMNTPTSNASSSPQFNRNNDDDGGGPFESSSPLFPLNNDDDSEGPFQSYYTDQMKVPTGNKIGVLLTVAVGVVDAFTTTVVGNVTTFSPPYPYSHFAEGTNKKANAGFNKSKFIVTKKIISDEILRRSPKVKVNVKSATIGKLWEMLARHPLTDQRDKDFIIKQEKMFRKILLAQIVEIESGEVAGVARITDTDRLRFIVCLVNPTIRAAYMKSQNVKDREALDYANSDKRELDWKELIVEMFNDEELDVQTQSLPNLHDDFVNPIVCKKLAYTLTNDKAKDMIQYYKPKLRDIIRRYNASGNGSDMRIDDHDIDMEEREDSMCVAVLDKSGRFNRETAVRRATTLNDGDLILKDGDDRANFLRYESSTLLYWWHVMDEHNLLVFTFAKLADELSATACSKPKSVSRHDRKASEKKTTAVVAQDSRTKEMTDDVRRMRVSMESMADATKLQQIIRLEDRLYEFEEKLLDMEDVDKDDARKKLLKKRIRTINSHCDWK